MSSSLHSAWSMGSIKCSVLSGRPYQAQRAELTSVCTIWQRCARIRLTKPYTSTFLSACIMSSMASMTMKVPVRPTPALHQQRGKQLAQHLGRIPIHSIRPAAEGRAKGLQPGS